MNLKTKANIRFHFFSLFVALLAASLAVTELHAQMKVLRVNPQLTNPAIDMVKGPHVAVYDPQVPSNHRLFLFFVGTGGRAAGSLTMDKAFANWGYHAIGLDYEDNVETAPLGRNPNPATLGLYREAIITGAPVSSDIHVTPSNSILNRFQALLVYLIKKDPKGGWNEFLDHGHPVWSRIIVAGHSQGTGHAAYIGQMFHVDRVLMFSGPQDYMESLHEPAPWQARKSATPPDRFFAFLSLKDPFNDLHQIANCAVLMHLSNPHPFMVQPGEEIHGMHQILMNNFPTKHPHGATILPQFENVWKYMATVKVK